MHGVAHDGVFVVADVFKQTLTAGRDLHSLCFSLLKKPARRATPSPSRAD
jgi:hypothetical protein